MYTPAPLPAFPFRIVNPSTTAPAALMLKMRQEPLLYVLEDLHHADALTLELTMRASHLARLSRCLLVVTYRPDPVIASLARAVEEQVELGALDRAGMGELIRHELRADNVDDPLLSFCVARTAGNPGQATNLIRFLKDQGLVSVRAGVAVTPGGEGFLDGVVPASMANVALARIDELGEVERRLLRTASAIGQRFGKNVLQKVATIDLDPQMITAAMANLEGERVIALDEGSRGYHFRDDVTRAVAYGTLPEEKRREVHRKIADALESLPIGDPARAPAALAIHRERAGQFALAAVEYEKAALLAMNAGSSKTAAASRGPFAGRPGLAAAASWASPGARAGATIASSRYRSGIARPDARSSNRPGAR
jgi:adenylate cyclase